MSHGNMNHSARDAAIDLVTRYYAAFDAADMSTFVSLLDDHVVHDVNQGHREVGRDAFVAFLERMNRSYREHIHDLVVLATDDGTRASAEFVVTGEYVATDEGLPEAHGQTYRLSAGAFFELRDGRVARVTNYYNLEDWLRQVRR